MLKQDRFLTGILICIAVLIVVVITVFFLRRDSQTFIEEDTPQGVLHNYILALQQREYEKAYGYLADLDNKPEYESFRQEFMLNRMDPENTGLKVGDVDQQKDEAYVEIILIHIGSGPFSDPYNYTEMASLVKQSGEWKIAYMPYPFWMWDWYTEEFKMRINEND